MSAYQKEINVICLGDPKQSAIYFDKIIPISYCLELLSHPKMTEIIKKYDLSRGFSELPRKVAYEFIHEAEVFESLLGTSIDVNMLEKQIKPYLDYFTCLFNICIVLVELYSRRREEKGKGHAYLIEQIGDRVPESIIQMLDSISGEKETSEPNSTGVVRGLLDLLCLFYIENLAPWGGKREAKDRSFREEIDSLPIIKAGQRRIVLPSSCFNYLKATDNDLTIYLSNLQLIDTSKADWKKIVEFRKDKETRRKLGNLRLFLYTTYEGKNLAFIEDDLHRRLEQYDETCKEWGFETTTSSIMAVMDSRSLLPTIGTTLAAAILGHADVAATAALTGSFLEIGKIALGYARAKHSFQKLKREHDLAFIIEAKERLEKL
jgi:hypothetical protein